MQPDVALFVFGIGFYIRQMQRTIFPAFFIF